MQDSRFQADMEGEFHMHLAHRLATTLKVALLAVFLALPASVPASSGAPAAPGTPENLDFIAGERAIQAKDWALALAYFSRVTDDRDFAARAHNWMGYAERQRGDLNAAFRHYGKALALDPGLLGAHEYVGEAHLMAGNLARAEEHLAILARLCAARCEEYLELKEKIARYKRKG
jgi:tetratricopeptide (TPR) repeat protein